jgi:hypothetical protein
VKSALRSRLVQYGAPADGVVLLDSADPRIRIRYLDLIRPPIEAKDAVLPHAVIEVHQRPVVYVVDAERVSGPEPFLPRLRRTLAFRGDASFMAVVEPGRLTIYDVALEREARLPPAREVSRQDTNAGMVIPELALTPHIPHPRERPIAVLLLELLDRTNDALTRLGVAPEDALSLTGRALFLRFLIDRGIVTDADRVDICPSAQRLVDALATPQAASDTNRWLDETFNGDLLPLPKTDRKWLRTLAPRVYEELTRVVQKADPWGQLSFDWGDIDFGHVPVGLLSQVYERHSHRFHSGAARAASIHYTPRHIAEYMVEEAFFGLRNPEAAKVLDPACGAGVFLVAAFRHIVAAKWRRDGAQPRTPEIRRILREQIAGFDVNEAALRLAALSLYLTALELDPNPRPPSKLRFDDLRGTALHDVRTPAERKSGWDTRVAGALGPTVGKEHEHRYDVVIGNPPWTAWGGENRRSDVALFNDVVDRLKPVVEERLGLEIGREFAIPDYTPDLPFVWRAMTWARRGGRIAMALHARLLFKSSPTGRLAREQLFSALTVTGVLNGAALRQTKVWPDVLAPFCLLFADNRKPGPDDAFYYVSPARDPALNSRGQLRIDPASAEPVTLATVIERPHALKTLYRGTPLDVEVIHRIQHAGERVRLAEYWDELGLKYGEGYQVGGEAGTQQDARMIRGLPDLTKAAEVGLLVNTDQLPKLSHRTLLRTRSRELYRAPLVLALQSPGVHPGERWARLAFDDVAFSRSFIGYSCHGHPDAEDLARYLFLLLNAQLHTYYALMTSSQFGVERPAFLKADYDDFPVPRFETLSTASRKEVRGLADRLASHGERALNDVRAFVASLYGLRTADIQAINDALDVALPFDASEKVRATAPPNRQEREQFATIVAQTLAPLLEPFTLRPSVRILQHETQEPWIFVDVRTSTAATADLTEKINIGRFTRDADALGCAQIIVRATAPRRLLVGTLTQYRYWTPTRARLTALTILRSHQDLLLPDTENVADALS